MKNDHGPHVLQGICFVFLLATLGTRNLLYAGESEKDGAVAILPATGPLLSGPYIIDLRTDGGVVCWQTTAEAIGTLRVKTESSTEWTEAKETKPTRFHAVKLTGLVADTEHTVVVLSGDNKIGELAFRTAPEKAAAFTFFAYGDTRTNSNDHARVVAALLAEAQRLNQFTFVLHTGDFAEKGSDEESTAKQFFRPASAMLSRLPLVPVRGNHENDTDLYPKYFPRLEISREIGPTDDRCFDYGSVRIVVLDKYAPLTVRDARMKWLREKLAEATDRWRIVSLHEPIYTSGKHGSAMQTRQVLEPILVAYKVHAVLAGHDHNYERTKPIKGVTHFTIGGGGAPLRGKHDWANQWDWSAKFVEALHFAEITVTPEKLTVKIIQPTGGDPKTTIIDDVVIQKDCMWPKEGGESNP